MVSGRYVRTHHHGRGKRLGVRVLPLQRTECWEPSSNSPPGGKHPGVLQRHPVPWETSLNAPRRMVCPTPRAPAAWSISKSGSFGYVGVRLLPGMSRDDERELQRRHLSVLLPDRCVPRRIGKLAARLAMAAGGHVRSHHHRSRKCLGVRLLSLRGVRRGEPSSDSPPGGKHPWVPQQYLVPRRLTRISPATEFESMGPSHGRPDPGRPFSSGLPPSVMWAPRRVTAPS